MNLVMKKAGMTDDSEDYTCGYTTGCLGMWTPAPTPPPTPPPEYEPALRMTVGCRGPTAPKVFKDVVKPSNVKHQPGLINMGKNVPALKIDGEDAGTMRGQRNRDARARRVTRYAEPAARVRYYSYASKQYGVDVTKQVQVLIRCVLRYKDT